MAVDHVQDPDDVITDLQKEVFEAQGVAGEWGIKCLGLVADTYQDDSEFMQLFVAMVERWVERREACIIHNCQHHQVASGKRSECTQNALLSIMLDICAGKKKQSMKQSCLLKSLKLRKK